MRRGIAGALLVLVASFTLAACNDQLEGGTPDPVEVDFDFDTKTKTVTVQPALMPPAYRPATSTRKPTAVTKPRTTR